MNAFNWDEYFHRKQELLYSIWIEDYEAKVSKARDPELARIFYAIPFTTDVLLDVPLEIDMITLSGVHGNEKLNTIEKDFYSGLYPTFKFLWLLNGEHPLKTFIAEHLESAVASYIYALSTEAWDYEMKELAEPLAKEFINNRSLVKKVVRWLIYRFALDRAEYYLRKELRVIRAVDFNLGKFLANRNIIAFINIKSCQPSSPENLEKSDSKLRQFISNHNKSIQNVLLPDNSKGEEKSYVKIAKRFLALSEEGKNKRDVMRILAEEGIPFWTVYRALKISGIDIKQF